MATKQEIVADIRKNYGNALNIEKLTEALGYKDRRAAKKFMSGLPPIDMGKEKKWLAIDIGRRVYERQVVDTS